MKDPIELTGTGKQKIVTRKDGSRDVQFFCEGESLTRQSAKDETDINNIMKKYITTGQFTHVAEGIPFWADVTQIGDYRSAIDAVRAAQDGFLALPANIRSQFDNDPARLIEFLEDDKNYDKAVELGLVPRREPAPEKPKEGNPSAGDIPKA